MKPNLFKIATSELSQDGFFTWLLQWGDISAANENGDLHNIAQSFIRVLINEDIPITTVKTGRQLKKIDIWAKINDEIFIVIEDKTNTLEHSKQLERYKKFAEKHFENRQFKLSFIYLKTGNESSATLDRVSHIGYKIIDRKALLNVLNSVPVKNDIFNDFLEYMQKIENETNKCDKLENITKYRRAGEGFFIKLQENIETWSDWRYVANPAGGFLGFWYHWRTIKGIGFLHIQIENSFDRGIKLVIKISDWNQQVKILHKALIDLKNIAIKNGITIYKPNTFRPGKVSTLAIVKDAFVAEDNGDFCIEKFVNILHCVEKTLDEYKVFKEKVGNENYE
jgi:hypothetical protein